MKRSTIAFIQMLVIFISIILVHECSTQDSDAIVFSDEIDVARVVEQLEQPMEQQSERSVEQKTEREDKRIRNDDVTIDNRNIITAPTRQGKSCPVCKRLDPRGNCRKIDGCVP